MNDMVYRALVYGLAAGFWLVRAISTLWILKVVSSHSQMLQKWGALRDEKLTQIFDGRYGPDLDDMDSSQLYT